LTQADQCAGLIADVEKSLGAVDQLINNAGMNVRKRAIRELSLEDWNALIRTNLDGAFYCLRAVLPGMLARRNGVIVNIVSVAGKRANPLGGAGYVAAKFGMGGLGMCLSNEERESGIRVSNIYPGEIDTPILANRPKPVSDEQRKLILKPDDVAAAVMFVATLPVHVSVPELIIKPTAHAYW
jgi:NADP-dependent 3-hydroxy acid dehydrogenase YdfG